MRRTGRCSSWPAMAAGGLPALAPRHATTRAAPTSSRSTASGRAARTRKTTRAATSAAAAGRRRMLLKRPALLSRTLTAPRTCRAKTCSTHPAHAAGNLRARTCTRAVAAQARHAAPCSSPPSCRLPARRLPAACASGICGIAWSRGLTRTRTFPLQPSCLHASMNTASGSYSRVGRSVFARRSRGAETATARHRESCRGRTMPKTQHAAPDRAATTKLRVAWFGKGCPARTRRELQMLLLCYVSAGSENTCGSTVSHQILNHSYCIPFQPMFATPLQWPRNSPTLLAATKHNRNCLPPPRTTKHTNPQTSLCTP
mmetsp:Transcript_30593/g.90678  ORF Transcript_30593/g.90678 Transcript_30593/m.90678 type:complete len:315 (+) Transcript_30593:210-1154(+)